MYWRPYQSKKSWRMWNRPSAAGELGGLASKLYEVDYPTFSQQNFTISATNTYHITHIQTWEGHYTPCWLMVAVGKTPCPGLARTAACSCDCWPLRVTETEALQMRWRANTNGSSSLLNSSSLWEWMYWPLRRKNFLSRESGPDGNPTACEPLAVRFKE